MAKASKRTFAENEDFCSYQYSVLPAAYLPWALSVCIHCNALICVLIETFIVCQPFMSAMRIKIGLCMICVLHLSFPSGVHLSS